MGKVPSRVQVANSAMRSQARGGDPLKSQACMTHRRVDHALVPRQSPGSYPYKIVWKSCLQGVFGSEERPGRYAGGFGLYFAGTVQEHRLIEQITFAVQSFSWGMLDWMDGQADMSADPITMSSCCYLQEHRTVCAPRPKPKVVPSTC